MSKAVVVFSGGMDSYTVLHRALAEETEVVALSFNYGQRHSKELEGAAKVCREQDILHKIVDVSSINELMQGSALTSDIDVPLGHYEEESMKQTVVPNRNMVFLSLAVAYAVSIKADKVYCGVHAGDHAIYPDCRPEFIKEMNDVTKIANWQSVEIVAPYINTDKAGILNDGFNNLGLDYENTWTCYNGGEKACGKCGSCTERLLGFYDAGKVDPVEYEQGWDEALKGALHQRDNPPESKSA